MNREELLKIAKPILFNTEMVKAILEGRKTVTRRLVKPQPDEKHNYRLGFVSDSTNKKDIGKFGFGIDEFGGSIQHAKPPFKKGDYLYVRETWCKGAIDCGEEADGRDVLYVSQCEGEDDYILKAHALHENVGIEDVVWKPSIHMPKEAARIFLKVTAVRVELLQDITEEQATKEGCQAGFHEYKGAIWGQEDADEWTAVEVFGELWNSTIKKADLDKYGWDANPWVWVIEFDRIEVE